MSFLLTHWPRLCGFIYMYTCTAFFHVSTQTMNNSKAVGSSRFEAHSLHPQLCAAAIYDAPHGHNIHHLDGSLHLLSCVLMSCCCCCCCRPVSTGVAAVRCCTDHEGVGAAPDWTTGGWDTAWNDPPPAGSSSSRAGDSHTCIWVIDMV